MSKFSVNQEVLQKHFPEAPAMIVVKQIASDRYACRYQLGGQSHYGEYFEDELQPGFEEVVNQTIVEGDYVRHARLQSSPVMLVIRDYGNEKLFGCRYLANEVFHYCDFYESELERLTEEEENQYVGKLIEANI